MKGTSSAMATTAIKTATANTTDKRAGARIECAASRHWIRVKDILTDPETQRVLRPHWAREIAQDFDPDKLRPVVVSQRADGNYYVIDGQHRLGALKLMGYGEQLIECDVFDRRHATPAEVRKLDARLFLDLNHTLSQAPLEKFLKRINAEEPVPVAVAKIVSGNGLRIATGPTNGHIACVAALERIYLGCGSGKHMPSALAATLSTIIGAWGNAATNFNAKLVAGLGLAYVRHGRALEKEQAAFVSKLAQYPGGATALIGQAGVFYSIRNMQFDKCMAAVLIEVFNQKRPAKSKLDAWWK